MNFEELLTEAARHGQTPEGKGHGVDCVCMDEYIRKVRKAMRDAVTPAERIPLTPEQMEEAEQFEPNPQNFRITPEERNREMEERSRVRVILLRAVKGLDY